MTRRNRSRHVFKMLWNEPMIHASIHDTNVCSLLANLWKWHSVNLLLYSVSTVKSTSSLTLWSLDRPDLNSVKLNLNRKYQAWSAYLWQIVFIILNMSIVEYEAGSKDVMILYSMNKLCLLQPARVLTCRVFRIMLIFYPEGCYDRKRNEPSDLCLINSLPILENYRIIEKNIA